MEWKAIPYQRLVFKFLSQALGYVIPIIGCYVSRFKIRVASRQITHVFFKKRCADFKQVVNKEKYIEAIQITNLGMV